MAAANPVLISPLSSFPFWRSQRGFSKKNLSTLVSSRILGNPSFFRSFFSESFHFFSYFSLSSFFSSLFLFFFFLFFFSSFFFLFFLFFLSFFFFFSFFSSFSSFFFPFFPLFFSFSFSIASYGKKAFFLNTRKSWFTIKTWIFKFWNFGFLNPIYLNHRFWLKKGRGYLPTLLLENCYLLPNTKPNHPPPSLSFSQVHTTATLW